MSQLSAAQRTAQHHEMSQLSAAQRTAQHHEISQRSAQPSSAQLSPTQLRARTHAETRSAGGTIV
jgi:hypothetical protein